jgi:hypothetical protein
MSIHMFYVRTQVFGKRNILCGMCKKDKKCSVDCNIKICHFYTGHTEFISPENLCATFRYTCRFFSISLNIWNVFFKQWIHIHPRAELDLGISLCKITL